MVKNKSIALYILVFFVMFAFMSGGFNYNQYSKLQEVNKLQERSNVSSIDKLIFPYWEKDLEGNILYLNPAYEKVILNPIGIKLEEVVGTKGEIFGSEFVKTILENDRIVIDSKMPIYAIEVVPEIGTGTSVKYPRKNLFNEIVGTNGIWIPEDLPKMLQN